MELRASFSKAFIVVAGLGIVSAFYHAWLEGAFVTNYSMVSFAPWASFYGVPYWVFGVVWFPLAFFVGLWSTRGGRLELGAWLLALLTVGNVFTAYLWYLDIEVVGAFTLVYVVLYTLNYVLSAIVVLQHRAQDLMRGYVYGTVTGAIVGLLFGPYGVAACGIGGGIFGAMRNYVTPPVPARVSPP